MNNKRVFFWITITILFFVFLFLIRSILLPFILGIFIAYFLDPATDKLERLGCSRGLAAGIVILAFFFVIALLLLLVSPLFIGQITDLIAAVPAYMSALDHHLRPALENWLGGLPDNDVESIKNSITNVFGIVMRVAGDFIAGIFRSGIAFINIISLVLITPVVALYMLKDWHKIVAKVDQLLPRAHANTIRSQLMIIDRTLSGFLRGQLNVCLIMSVYYTVLLSAFGLKFSIVIGIMTGFLIIIPYAGWMLGATLGIGIAFFQFDIAGQVWAIVAVFLCGMVIEGYFLTPKLVGSKVGLHPVWIIFGMLSGAALFGFVGVLIAVPVTAVVGVLLRFAIQRYLQSGYYQGELA